MPNIAGVSQILPGVTVNVKTLSRGVSVPGGVRLGALMGEGSRREDLVLNALGGGDDGLDSTFTTTTGSDGRHFRLSLAPVISNRTTLYRNGIPLTLLEDSIDGSTFSSLYEARLEISSGKIELQTAHLVDQGGRFYSATSSNVGNGTLSDLELLDENAPTETWTIRCSSVRRDGYGDPIDGYAKFIAQGSVSGILLDGYGQQITWQSDGVVVSNGVLSFAINEGSTAFLESDRFSVKVKSGSLVKGDRLSAVYVAEIDINDIEFFTDFEDLTKKHGSVSLTNRLSLGGQLAFSNSPPGIWTVQCAPAVPRRVSYVLELDAPGGSSDPENLQFPLPLGVIPDPDSNIHFFVTDPATGIESQVIPNKVAFYDATITGNPNNFQSTYVFSYTVVLEDSVQEKGADGVLTALTATTATLSSDAAVFTADDVGRTVKLFNATNAGNEDTYSIVDVTDGVLTIVRGSGTFISETSIDFEVLDPTAQSSIVLLSSDLALDTGAELRATVVDIRDATFFDVGWLGAYEALEKIETDMVIPLPSQTISQIVQNGRIHCETMSNIKNKRERVLLTGAIAGLRPEHVTGVENAAVEDIGILEGIQGDDIAEILSGNVEDLTDYGVPNSFSGTFRVIYFYPDEIVVQIGADRTKVDGFFIAAAAAGYLSSVPNIAIPLTNKVISGFTILRDKIYRPITLESLAFAGITVLQPTLGGGRVIWGRTTTQSGFVEEQEISIVFIRDRLAKSLRAGFNGFIGTADSPSLQGSLMSRAVGLLNGFISQGLITDYRDLKVVRDQVDPTQWNISVSVQPTYPVNYINIEVSIGLL